MTKKIVTCMGPGALETYGNKFIESWIKHWPADMLLDIWTHDIAPFGVDDQRVSVRQLEDVEAFQKLKLVLKGNDGPSLQYSFKAIALANSVTPDLDWIAFVDADMETFFQIDDQFLGEVFDPAAELTYLWRKAVAESEGSWFAFNLRTPNGASLCADFYGLYVSLEFKHFHKQHDNAILDRLVTIHRAHGLRVKNLSEGALGLDAFHQSVLGAYMIHYKGPDKTKISNPGLAVPSRYNILCDLLKFSIEATGRAGIVEVGTWNGSRAIHMAESAFETGLKAVSYVGFDTFEEGNDRQREGHTKPHASAGFVQRRLSIYKEHCARKGLDFNFVLVPGNTLTTLGNQNFTQNASFCYIDGGHSVETVQSDYAALKHIPYVVFDDIIKEPEEGAPDGPREVFNELTCARQLIHTNDGYAGLSQTIALGLVVQENFPMPPPKQQQIVVRPVDSVDKSEQVEHIKTNTAALQKWMQAYQAHVGEALLVSAGPTLSKNLDDIKARQAKGATIFCVKHAFPILKAAGISPDYCVVLDPRPIEGKSTHGVIRTTLFDDIVVGDKFLIASMTHPSVREWLEVRGGNLIGWHAHTQLCNEHKLDEFKKGLVVGGGTCAATRLPMLAFVMGFRRFSFYGYDFFYEEGTSQEHIKQELMRIDIQGGQQPGEIIMSMGKADGGVGFLTTGELVAAMQDLGQITKWLMQNQLSVRFVGDGAGAQIWHYASASYVAPGEYEERPLGH